MYQWIGLIQVKEEGWTEFSEGLQGCSEGFPKRCSEGFPRAAPRDFPRAAPRNFPRAAPSDLLRAKPEGNLEEQPCQPEEKPCPSRLFYLDLHYIYNRIFWLFF